MKNGGVLLQYVYLLFYWFYLSKTLIVIYLFKLLRLMHDRIDPTIDMLKRKPLLKRKKTQRTENSSIPPTGAPSWCLSREALERFNRSSVNIPVYDYDTDEVQDNNSDNDTEVEEIQRKKRKTKKKLKQKRNKKHKSK